MNIKDIKKISKNETEEKKRFNYILKGILIAIIITIIMLLIFSIVLASTNINESAMIPIISTITAISIVIGGITSTRKLEKNGMIIGAITGLIYITILYIFSSIVTENFSINLPSIILICASIVAGMIGGIIGINLK